jgi:transcriptional regulator with XRE-family HTH domain
MTAMPVDVEEHTMTARRADASDAIVGLNIRTHRLARRMSQTALADALGVTFQQVQKYERGANRLGSGRLVRVATALRVPVAALLAGVPGAAAPGESQPGTPQAGMSQVTGLLAHPHRLRLVQAFAQIDDTDTRRHLMLLTESVARLARDAARAGRGARPRA